VQEEGRLPERQHGGVVFCSRSATIDCGLAAPGYASCGRLGSRSAIADRWPSLCDLLCGSGVAGVKFPLLVVSNFSCDD
jgi:hypothetical protein